MNKNSDLERSIDMIMTKLEEDQREEEFEKLLQTN